jgi:hypothetical protein
MRLKYIAGKCGVTYKIIRVASKKIMALEKCIIIFVILFNVKMSAQLRLDSVKIYKDFVQRGYTLGGAYYHFTELANEGRETVWLSTPDLAILNGLIEHSESKKCKVIKFGIENIFAIGYSQGKSQEIVIASRWIVNLATKKMNELTNEQSTELEKLIATWKQ